MSDGSLRGTIISLVGYNKITLVHNNIMRCSLNRSGAVGKIDEDDVVVVDGSSACSDWYRNEVCIVNFLVTRSNFLSIATRRIPKAAGYVNKL